MFASNELCVIQDQATTLVLTDTHVDSFIVIFKMEGTQILTFYDTIKNGIKCTTVLFTNKWHHDINAYQIINKVRK